MNRVVFLIGCVLWACFMGCRQSRTDVRSFKWDIIRQCLAYIENMQQDTTLSWGVLQNYKNLNREAPLVHTFVRNEYGRVSDTLGVERYQSVPLYAVTDTLVPVRYVLI